jgi:hypothetical protein
VVMNGMDRDIPTTKVTFAWDLQEVQKNIREVEGEEEGEEKKSGSESDLLALEGYWRFLSLTLVYKGSY